MKRILIVIVIVIVTLLLCGCGKKEPEETQQRFAIEYRQMLGFGEHIIIIRDTETGEAYLFAHDVYAGGLTILEEGE